MAKSITASNAVFTLVIAGLFPAPQQVNEFAADDVYAVDAVEPTEIVMGVDGVMSAGFVYVPVKQNITIAGNSPSNDLFDAWVTAQQVAGDQYFAEGLMSFPAIRRKWVMTGGTLSTFPPMPDIGKTIRPRRYGMTWERVFPVPF